MLYDKKQKKGLKPLLGAKDFLASKGIAFKLPKQVILMPFGGAGKFIKTISRKNYKLLCDIDIIGDNTAVAHGFQMGAPLTVALAEILAALGAGSFILLGSAGGIKPGFEICQSVICAGAFCDEGTSPNYIEADFVRADEGLTRALCAALPTAVKAYSWTTDAIFKETREEAAYYAALGAASVEMEASALFAFAEAAGLKAAAVFVISDLLAESWTPARKNQNCHAVILENLKSIIKALK
jgi:uridine phosphorylase